MNDKDKRKPKSSDAFSLKKWMDFDRCELTKIRLFGKRRS